MARLSPTSHSQGYMPVANPATVIRVSMEPATKPNVLLACPYAYRQVSHHANQHSHEPISHL